MINDQIKQAAKEAAVHHFFADIGAHAPDAVATAVAAEERTADMKLYSTYVSYSSAKLRDELASMILWIEGLMLRALELGNPLPLRQDPASEAHPVSDYDYVRKLGIHCPACGAEALEGDVDGALTDGNMATHDVRCLNCGATWRDQYALVGYTDLQFGQCRRQYGPQGETLADAERLVDATYSFWGAFNVAYPEINDGESNLTGEDQAALAIWLLGGPGDRPIMNWRGTHYEVPSSFEERIAGVLASGLEAAKAEWVKRGGNAPATGPEENVRKQLEACIRNELHYNLPKEPVDA